MTTSTCSAADPGLPFPILEPTPRRGFLRQLASLPLIGGSVSLIGKPRAVAQPATRQMLEAYKSWLHLEHRSLSWEMANLPEIAAYYGGTHRDRYDIIEPMTMSYGTGDAYSFHRYDGTSPASGRAALVLSTVGCDWHDDEAPADWLFPLRRA